MYGYGLLTVRHVVFELRWIPQSSLCSSDKVSRRRNSRRRSVPTTKRQVTKCTRDEMAGNEVYPRRNGWRWSVPAMKWQRRNGSDETSCSVVQRKMLPKALCLSARRCERKFGQGKDTSGMLKKHPNEVWMRYFYSTDEPWSKVSLFYGRKKLPPSSRVHLPENTQMATQSKLKY